MGGGDGGGDGGAGGEGGGFGVALVVCAKRLGRARPGVAPADVELVSVFETASPLSVAQIAFGVEKTPSFCEIWAARPATCGHAIEVPEIILVALLLVNQEDVIDWPGAKMSTHDPAFE